MLIDMDKLRVDSVSNSKEWPTDITETPWSFTFLSDRKREYCERTFHIHKSRTRGQDVEDLRRVLKSVQERIKKALVTDADVESYCIMIRSLMPVLPVESSSTPAVSTGDFRTLVMSILPVRETDLEAATSGTTEAKAPELIRTSYAVRVAQLSALNSKYCASIRDNIKVLRSTWQRESANTKRGWKSIDEAIGKYISAEERVERDYKYFLSCVSGSNKRYTKVDIKLRGVVDPKLDEVLHSHVVIAGGLVDTIPCSWIGQRAYNRSIANAGRLASDLLNTVSRSVAQLDSIAEFLRGVITEVVGCCLSNHRAFIKAVGVIENLFLDLMEHPDVEHDVEHELPGIPRFIVAVTPPMAAGTKKSDEEAQSLLLEVFPVLSCLHHTASTGNSRNTTTRFGLATTVAFVSEQEMPQEFDNMANVMTSLMKSTRSGTSETTTPCTVVLTWDRFLHVFSSLENETPTKSFYLPGASVKQVTDSEEMLLSCNDWGVQSSGHKFMSSIGKFNFANIIGDKLVQGRFRFAVEDIKNWAALLTRGAIKRDEVHIPISILLVTRGESIAPETKANSLVERNSSDQFPDSQSQNPCSGDAEILHRIAARGGVVKKGET